MRRRRINLGNKASQTSASKYLFLYLHCGSWFKHGQLILQIIDFGLQTVSLLEDLFELAKGESRTLWIVLCVNYLPWEGRRGFLTL